MDKENKVLLLAFLIIIGTLISSGIENITGKVINKRSTKISISPYKTYAGENMQITIFPGEDGIDNEAIICNPRGVKLSSTNICSNNHRCEQLSTFDFTIPKNWKSGDYQIRVYDYALKDFIKGDFTIKGGL